MRNIISIVGISMIYYALIIIVAHIIAKIIFKFVKTESDVVVYIIIQALFIICGIIVNVKWLHFAGVD
jgi:hypothetical protein